MRDKDIHNEFNDKDLRNFFATQLLTITFNDIDRERPSLENSNGLDYSIASLENEISFNQKRLKNLKDLRSVSELIKMKGWTDFDISELNIIKTGKYYLSFIGTQEEYEELVNYVGDER